MNIADVNKGIQKNTTIKRIGRGVGSGWGKTAGRGHKGQGSRAGFSMPAQFEGGQMPLARRIPKRGFTNRFADKVVGINVGDLEILFESGETITPDILVEQGIIKKVFDQIKILGDGELKKSLNVSAHKFSATAKQKIEAVGGSVVVLPGPAPVVKNKMKPKRVK
ncbi:MAG: 50S ribosomal protein L15 [Thermoguttaceae bacterium]